MYIEGEGGDKERERGRESYRGYRASYYAHVLIWLTYLDVKSSYTVPCLRERDIYSFTRSQYRVWREREREREINHDQYT